MRIEANTINIRIKYIRFHESIQAAIDAQVKAIMPVHQAGFALAQHSLTEYIEQFMKASDKEKFKVYCATLRSCRTYF